jgi:hypothetical protein
MYEVKVNVEGDITLNLKLKLELKNSLISTMSCHNHVSFTIRLPHNITLDEHGAVTNILTETRIKYSVIEMFRNNIIIHMWNNQASKVVVYEYDHDHDSDEVFAMEDIE